MRAGESRDDSVLLREGLVRLLDGGRDSRSSARRATREDLLRKVAGAQARRRDRRHPHAADPHRRGPARRARRSAPSCPRSACWCCRSTSRRATRCELLADERRGRRLPAEGPRRRRRALHRRRPPRGRGRLGARPRGRLAACSAAGAANDPLDELTPREREVLELMAEGRSNHAIADAARGHRARGREARDEHLRKARPGAHPRRPPPRAGRARLREEGQLSSPVAAATGHGRLANFVWPGA